MSRCPECSAAAGQAVDHTPYLDLPPLLARFEHFLATKGTLGRPMGAPDKDLPTRAGAVPSLPASEKHAQTCLQALLHPLVEMGLLTKTGKSGQWTAITGKDVRDLSARQILDYITKRFPPQPCKSHRDGCERCCLPHHLSMYNKTCEAFRKMAEWLYFEERLYGKPVWSKAKLVEVYGVTRRRKYTVRPPRMNDVETSHRFQEWLEGRDKAYGYMVWFLQELGLRYEEMVRAEFPLEGPSARLNRSARVLDVTGKGRLGGKTRTVTLTDVREVKLQEILTWRKKLGEVLANATGRAPDPVLFVVDAGTNENLGHARSDKDPSAFNRGLKTWGGRYNEWCEAEGHEDLKLDVTLLSSHKIGRPVFITHRLARGVERKTLRDEVGIADDATLDRYDRPSQEERRTSLARADRKPDNGEVLVGGDPLEAIDHLIEMLPAGQARDLVEPTLIGVRETLRRLTANGTKGAA